MKLSRVFDIFMTTTGFYWFIYLAYPHLTDWRRVVATTALCVGVLSAVYSAREED